MGLRSKMRKNVGEGAEWGAEGETAFELELAVKNAIADVDPYLAKRIEVVSSYSPRGKEIRTALVRLHGVIARESVSAVYIVTSALKSLVAATFNQARDILNREWAPPKTEWFWDVVVRRLNGIYEFSRGPKPWRWKQMLLEDGDPFFDTEEAREAAGIAGTLVPFWNQGRDDYAQSDSTDEMMHHLRESRGAWEPAFKAYRDQLGEWEVDWVDQNEEFIDDEGADPAEAFASWRDGFMTEVRVNRPAIELLYQEERGVENPKSVLTGPKWTAARDKLRSAAAGVRKNPGEPPTAALEKYEEFHRYTPKAIGEFASGFSIPSRVLRAGTAKWTTYRSAKVDPETLQKPRRPVNYIHEHDAGVHVYVPEDADAPELDGDPCDVPSEFCKVTALVKLGDSLGFCYEVDGEKVEAEGTDPLPELYCTPDGRCLLVVQDKSEVLAMMWGGALGVFARGIDG